MIEVLVGGIDWMVDLERASAFREVAADRYVAEKLASQPGSGAARSAPRYRDKSPTALLAGACAKRADGEQAIAAVARIYTHAADEAPARSARAGVGAAAESDNAYPAGSARATSSQRDHARAPANARTRVASCSEYRWGTRRYIRYSDNSVSVIYRAGKDQR